MYYNGLTRPVLRVGSEPEVPSLVTAAGDGPAVTGRPGGAPFRPADGYQSEAELGGASPRGRGAQRGRGARGGRGAGGDAGRYCETDVDELSPARPVASRGRRQPRSPPQNSVADAIRPLEAPAQSVLSHLVRQPGAAARHGAAPRTPPRGPAGAGQTGSLLGSPPVSVTGAGQTGSLLGSPPASLVAASQARPPAGTQSAPARAGLLKTPPAAQRVVPPPAAQRVVSPPAAQRVVSPPAAQRVVSPPAAPAPPAAAAPPVAVYAVTLEPGNTYQVGH